MELLTNDLILRTLDDNDIDKVARMGKWLKEEPVSVDDARKTILEYADNHRKNKQGYIYHLCLAVFEKGDDKIIGWCGLDGRYPKGKRTTALFYSIDTAYRNKGYATQCARKLFEYLFESVGLQRIDGGCYKENIASWRVMEKAGMVLFEYDEIDGGPHFYIDTEIYLKLKNRTV
jgi:[ribosomal protein S5]-alanine N-acetyltransferase